MLNNRSIIAEIGSVHDGSFGNAICSIDLAKRVGADIVKFQTHLAQHETTPTAKNPSYFDGESRYDYFERTGFSTDQWLKLIKYCESINVEFLTSVFSIESFYLMRDLGCSFFKIPSGEVTNLPLLEAIAKSELTVILSTGMSNWAEIDDAVSLLKQCKHLNIMQCTSQYPCPVDKVGLNILDKMRLRYKAENISFGFSDHTLGPTAAIGAVFKGATCIEKHLTFSNYMYGSDAQFATEPDKFQEYVNLVNEAWDLLKYNVDKDDISYLTDMKDVFQKSVVLNRPLSAGSVIKSEYLACKKPGTGIPPSKIHSLIGRTIINDLPNDHLLGFEDLK